MTAPVIRPEPATSLDAQGCVRAYYEELATVFPAGFDPAAGAVVDYEGLAPPTGQFLMVEHAGVARGCGVVHLLTADIAEIKRMWIAPELRGQGLGQKMLDALEEWAATLGSTTVRLDTSQYLHAAIKMYRRSGYAEIEPYNENPYAHLWFEKRLSASTDQP